MTGNGWASRLRKERRQAFFQEIAPYLRYAVRSGLGTLILILLIVAAACYTYLLQTEETGVDVRWIAFVLMVPLLALRPVRTYLKQPDILFALPAEGRMKREYFRGALRSSWISQSAAVAVLWGILLPLLARHVPGYSVAYWLQSGIALIGIKTVLLAGRWTGSQWVQPSWRRAERAACWLLAAAALLPLGFPEPAAWVLLTALACLYAVLLRVPERFAVNWLQLLEEEERTRSRWLHFFSWFVDVESVSGRPERRRWLDPLARRIPYGKEHSYEYLYMRVFLRSELWSMVFRLTIAGILFVAVWDSVWLKAFSFLFFAWVTGVQLSALYQHHVHSDWLHVYPLPEGLREQSIGRLIRRIHLAVVICLGAALVLAAWQWSWLAAAGVLLSWLLLGKQAKRMASLPDG